METSRVVILTASEIRHTFLRKSLAADHRLSVVRSYVEVKPTLKELLDRRDDKDPLALLHSQQRLETERRFFETYVKNSEDKSNPRLIESGALNNDEKIRDELKSLRPDVVLCFGTSIIKGDLLTDFPGRFVNIHLGLSPYYRGGATNFWPLFNCEPELVGATFMHIDAGVDTGNVIHQERAKYELGDDVHTIGFRVISKVAAVSPTIICRLRELGSVPQHQMNPLEREERVYRQRDFNGDAVREVQRNLSSGMIENYLANYERRDSQAPIVTADLEI